MSKSKLDTRDVHTIITDQWIEHFDLGEQEDEKYAKNYTSGFADDHTDAGTNNAFEVWCLLQDSRTTACQVA